MVLWNYVDMKKKKKLSLLFTQVTKKNPGQVTTYKYTIIYKFTCLLSIVLAFVIIFFNYFLYYYSHRSLRITSKPMSPHTSIQARQF